MAEFAIHAENLGKLYRLGETQRYKALRDTMADAMAAPYRLARAKLRPRPVGDPEVGQTIWALHDVSFEICRGSVVGLIGRNGAGKSTLLKVLSRITEPTTGRAEIRGRVGSLLEVGTGFHPELTGRDNIFLNGAILGMRKREIARKFDEIVEFAELERFMDTPVKRYSSGMYVRLAFAVAAHLEPEVLLVDEVLAVGDAAFQQKCLGKIDEVASGGRTVVLVSHNMSAVAGLCETAIWIDNGGIAQIGPAPSVIEQYLGTVNRSNLPGEVIFDDQASQIFHVRSVRLLDETGTMSQSFRVDEPPVVEICCVVRERVRGLFAHVLFTRSDGILVLEGDSYDSAPNPLEDLEPGEYTIRARIPPRTLGVGTYLLNLDFESSSAGWAYHQIDHPGTICTFHLDDFVARRGNHRQGYLSTQLDWRVLPE